jgi:hypothetical protein
VSCKKTRVHLFMMRGSQLGSACSPPFVCHRPENLDGSHTFDVGKVTCGSCKRTKFFKREEKVRERV